MYNSSNIAESENKEKGIEYFETVIRYIFGVGKDLTKYDVQKIVEQVAQTYPEGSGVVMTLAEYYKEKGKAEGKAEGQDEKTIEIILAGAKKGLDIELIAELTDCSVEEVEKVLKKNS